MWKRVLPILILIASPGLNGGAHALGAGIGSPVLGDSTPGAISRPFEIPISLTGTRAEHESLSIGLPPGFDVDPDMVFGTQIGVVDYTTDAGDFPGNPLVTLSGGERGNQGWEIRDGFSDMNFGGMLDGFGLDENGDFDSDAGSTIVSLSVPTRNYHGFGIEKMIVRFNVNADGSPSEAVGMVNPPTRGNYLIRSVVRTEEPDTRSVQSRWIWIGGKPKWTNLEVTPDRRRVRPGQTVTFGLRTVNGASDRVIAKLGKRKLRAVRVHPNYSYVTWRAPKRRAGKTLKFTFDPLEGPPRQLRIKVGR